MRSVQDTNWQAAGWRAFCQERKCFASNLYRYGIPLAL